jgi:hypothetical protein
MKNVMKRAWEIARQGVKKFGGKVKEYFAEALRIAWKEFKKGVKKMGKTETIRAMYKDAKELTKDFFKNYVTNMQNKGVKVENITADSVNMVAPSGLVAKAYVEMPNLTKVNDDVYEITPTIYVNVNGKLQRAGAKTFTFNVADYAN